MTKTHFFISLMAITSLACSSWQMVPISDIEPKNFVEITLNSGKTVQGEVIAVESQEIVVMTDGNAYKINNSSIAAIRTKPSVYDDKGEIITEKEIAHVKNHTQLFLYIVGGTALSFGASFFIGSMVQRSLDDDTDATPRILISSIGTAVGGTAFAFLGNRKDRTHAIEKIRDLRARLTEDSIAGEQVKRGEINALLEQLKKERQMQDAEIEALKKKIEEERKKQAEEKKKKKIPPQ